MGSKGRLAGAVSATLLILATGLGAQESRAQQPRELSQEQWRLATDRNRETMRFGEDPLVVVGIEQGDNDFRSNTPALQNTTGAIAMVDTHEAYLRKLAMYEGGERFTAPPPTVSTSYSPRYPAPPPVVSDSPSEPLPAVDEGSSPWSWILPMGGFGALILWVLRRNGFTLQGSG